MIKYKNFLTLIIFLLTIFNLIKFGYSQRDPINLYGQQAVKIILNIIKFLFVVFLIISTILTIYLGILYIVMGKTEINVMGTNIDLRKSLVYLVIGIVFLFISFYVPNFIRSFIESATSTAPSP